jgi:DNA gyrase subunit B
MKVEFIDGIPVSDPYKISNPGKQGTIITFWPSYEYLGEITLEYKTVLNMAKRILSLTPLGSTMIFTAIDKYGKEYSETFINEDGILTDLIMKTINPLTKPIIVSKDTGKMRTDIAFVYDSNDLMIDDITSFGNFCPTEAGSHIDGFLEGLCTFFRIYMNKIYLNGKSKISIINNDIKCGLKAIVTACHLYPIFTGQAKEILSNDDIKDFVKISVTEALDQWIKENPNDLQKLCKYFKDVAEIRMKSDESKIKLTNKYAASSLSGLPKKYVKPLGKQHLELLICEGDSAAGTAKNSRDNQTQGLFPIRGKIPNAFATEKTKFLSNPEIAGIITIVNGGYGKGFDIERVPWEKVIFMADADADGAHIDTLLLRFFLLYMMPMIIHGRVYRSVPPLYGIKRKNKFTYFTEKIDYVKYVQSEFSKNNKLEFNNKQLSSNDTLELLFNNIDYVYEVEGIANRYALDPYLLELVLIYRNESVDKIRNVIKQAFRFVDLEIINKTPIIRGLINCKSQTLILSDKLLIDSKRIIDYINRNKSMYYTMNNNIMSLYGIMKTFQNSSPDGIQRYKGLGEMNPAQLAESTIGIENRTLIQYTIEDAKKEIETIRFLESNKSELLKDINVSRFDVLG